MSNKRKIDLAKLARVMARNMARASVQRPAPAVNEPDETPRAGHSEPEVSR